MYRWSLFVFVLSGLCLGCATRGAAPPAPSAAADPFVDCEWADPRDNMLICGAVFVAFMPQTTPATSFQVLFESAVAGIESSSGEEVHATPATLDSFPAGSSLMYLSSQGGSLEGMAFMGPPTEPSSAFFSLCLGKSESDPKGRCEAMLVAAIAGHMPQRLAPPEPPPDAMVGPHRVKMFEGCKHTLEDADLQKVLCGSTESDVLTWVPMFKVEDDKPADLLWGPMTRHYSEMEGIEVVEVQGASCTYHGTVARSCRFLAMRDVALGKTYQGAMLLVEFGSDAFALQCFSTRPDQLNLCSLNEISITPSPAP